MSGQKRRAVIGFGIRMRTFVTAMVLVAAVVAPAASQEAAAPPEPVEDSGWNYDATLYGWFSGLSGEIGMGAIGQEIDATFSDLAGFVDFAMAGHFEARNPKVFLLADLSYVGLGAERDAEIAGQPASVDMDLDQWIIEAGGGWRLSREFDLLLTGRWYILDLGSTAESVAGASESEANQNWGDIFIGGRYSKMLWKKWLVSVRGDIGAGGSDFAWYVNAAAGYQFTDLISAIASWRMLGLDHTGDSEDFYFKYDVTQMGLGVGLRCTF